MRYLILVAALVLPAGASAQCNPQAIALAIDRANPGVSDSVKLAAFKDIWFSFCQRAGQQSYTVQPQAPTYPTQVCTWMGYNLVCQTY